MTRREPQGWVYNHLVCEFTHYDFCLTGLVEVDGELMWCEVVDDGDRDPEYDILPIEWTDECSEYLNDYRVAYSHWVYENGIRSRQYGGWNLEWFSEKWKHRNPIKAALVGGTNSEDTASDSDS